MMMRKGNIFFLGIPSGVLDTLKGEADGEERKISRDYYFR